MEKYSDVSPPSSFESLSSISNDSSFDSASFYSKHYRRTKGSYKAMVSSPRSALFFSDPLSDVEQHHFLDSCYLCKKALKLSRDIYMYKGDTPFCSEECRQEQIDIDEVKEIKKKCNKSMSSTSRSQKAYERRAASAVVAS